MPGRPKRKALIVAQVGERLCNHSQNITMTASESFVDPNLPGVEDCEEFDEASNVAKFYVKPVSVEEFENQAETETEKAIGDLMDYLDTHKDEFSEHLKRKKRQDLENGGVFSFVKVKVMDMIHGNDSPLVRVGEKERDKKLESLKCNMQKAFDISLETKGRRASKRLQEKRQKKTTSSTNSTRSPVPSKKSSKNRPPVPPPAPPPPPPIPPFLEQTTPKMKPEPRKPFTPIENRMSEFKTPKMVKSKQDCNDSFGNTPAVNVSLTSLHQELMSSNPWKRLKCVGENRSPGGTPDGAKKSQSNMMTPVEPLHIALVNKFRNVRSPSPANTSISVTSPGDFTP